MLCSPKPCFPLIECIRVAIDILRFDASGEDDDGIYMPLERGEELGMPKFGKKRLVQNNDNIQCKRQKTVEMRKFPIGSMCIDGEFRVSLTCKQDKEFADELQQSLILFVGFLRPGISDASPLKPDAAIAALSLLCIVFSAYPNTRLAARIFQLVLSWIPWICSQVCRTFIRSHGCKSITSTLSIFLFLTHFC